MDMMFEAYLTHEASNLDPDDIPHTKEPVWILGKKYNAIDDLEAIRKDIESKLWFTYRRGFVPIGDSGLTTDKGWGCMLRCGQMVLAQALVCRHIGRDWCWSKNSGNEIYLRILRMFEDRRAATYSIHQIALTEASEGKQVGQWFGPNTVVQVLKKLVTFDDWSSLVIHVALDNTIIIDEVKELCMPIVSQDPKSGNTCRHPWKPLLLVVPLRLGLNEINPLYVESLKTCFKFRHSLGVIGGKPNVALYFIGFVGDEVLFLDPHTTQQTGFIEDMVHDYEKEIDSSYHCQYASRIHVLNMDPSVAVCFFCDTEDDFDSLCEMVKEHISPEKQPLFEICKERPKTWSPVEDSAEEASAFIAIDEIDREVDCSDEDFELL